MTLADKVVLVTGSSSGIGRAIALRFAQESAKVVVNYHENKAGGEETLDAIRQLGAEGIVVQADLGTQEGVDTLFAATTDHFSRLDILINNAAQYVEKKPFAEAGFDDIRAIMDVGVTGLMLCSQRAVEIMRLQGSGKILNTTSIRGWEYGGGNSPIYAATKAAVNNFTRTLAKHVAPEITVNAVGPGFVKTRAYQNKTDEQAQVYLDQTYLKRWVTEEEIADAFIFLARNDAMTGQIIYVDGGFMLK